MGITLRELSEEGRNTYKMQQKSCSRSLNRQVAWVHIIEDLEVANFLHGGELVFTTGIARKDELWLGQFVENLNSANAAGLVVNTGPYIDRIDGAVVELAERLDFPIFSLPWNVRLVDVTKNFCDKIILSNKREESIGDLFKSYVHKKSDDAFTRIKERGFDLNGEYLVYGFKIFANEATYHAQVRLKLNIHQIFLDLNLNFAHFNEGNTLYYVIENLTQKQEKDINVWLQDIDSAIRFQTYVSKHNDSIFNLPANYWKISGAIGSSYDGDFYSYDDLGVEKLLLAISKKDELKTYFDGLVRPLIEYDRQNGTAYYELLDFYINSNCSLQKVAEEFYLHKNTINYQLKKISSIIDLDISSFENRVQLFIIFKIDKIIN